MRPPVLLFAALTAMSAAPLLAQLAAPAQASAATPKMEPAKGELSLTPDLDRIRKSLEVEETIKLPTVGEDGKPRFYVEVTREMDFKPFLESFDLLNGPVPGGGFTHAEFLSMVTPKDLYSSVGITALEQVTAGATSALLAWLVKSSLEHITEAGREREIQQIREQIRRELEELEKNRSTKPPS